LSAQFRREFLRALREDEEFRYAVAGLIGLEDLREGVRGLADGQAELRKAVARLAEGQAELRKAVARLAEDQAELRGVVVRLAEDQAKTRAALRELARQVGETQTALRVLGGLVDETQLVVRELARQVGRLSETVGFGLEDIARVVVPGWLYRHEGIEVEELERRFLTVDGEEVEVNLYGEGRWDGEPVVVVGEARSRVYARDVVEFDALAERVRRVVGAKIYKVLFGYLIHPSAGREAKKRGVRLIASYMR
jgi:hypothetical protein